jgi:hypothetical protein
LEVRFSSETRKGFEGGTFRLAGEAGDLDKRFGREEGRSCEAGVGWGTRVEVFAVSASQKGVNTDRIGVTEGMILLDGCGVYGSFGDPDSSPDGSS